MKPVAVVEAYWQAMQSNDFARAARWLGDEFVCDWPQSGERILGRCNFVEINRRYPAAGPWSFTIVRLLAQGDEVVSEVQITDGVVHARAITFHRVEGDRIVQQTEYWPEQYESPAWRRAWVSPLPHICEPA
ncbi:nuclear transport factor 2 family protein [Aeromonas jandaei]|uniref:nuclear transport factor 2 family protein n=1 Tax=Aeromonas jandaei TaxID=650 RepID=UPI00111670E9|nr:nuclear transport factor 2 family protein [Aeromonas jandaei]TNI09288.1 polyketide cyclase [Aeromonas jandaei]